MADGVTLISANLVTVGIESLLYGIVLLLSFTFFYLHLSHVSGSSPSYGGSRLSRVLTPIFITSVFIFLTCTAHWVLTITRLFQAFVIFEGGQAPLLFYANLSESTEVAKTAFLIGTLIAADIMIAYRLWIIWGRNWYVVIVPVMTILGLCVSGIGIVYTLSRLKGGDTIFLSDVAHWITADYATTFITNIYSSGLEYEQTYRQFIRRRELMRVLATIIESASFYTSTSSFLRNLRVGLQPAVHFVDTLCQVAGTAFMMINVRVGLGWAVKGNNSVSQASSTGLQSRRNVDQSYVMRPVAVDISTVVHQDDGLNQEVKYDMPSQYKSV
ncbi:uncharacterized protein B0H18DRAFT_1104912 [Fomitopsis serialis]|uniref:uncharacterized protein n=1 Tax=Fomitopsis serialis TaxID=139415 RepID=UPI00200830F3|nr:uncharacterized protein B0H18DRAFT_1104912 [Neoantrodia serialis]KAH9924760.1 hypothetical protein B0H18DRAFT_1104912 [Neoantrodia serialis]